MAGPFDGRGPVLMTPQEFEALLEAQYRPAMTAAIAEVQEARYDMMSDIRRSTHQTIKSLRREKQDEHVGLCPLRLTTALQDVGVHGRLRIFAQICPEPYFTGVEQPGRLGLDRNNARFQPGMAAILWLQEAPLTLRMDLLPSYEQAQSMTLAQIRAPKIEVPPEEFSQRVPLDSKALSWRILLKIAEIDGFDVAISENPGNAEAEGIPSLAFNQLSRVCHRSAPPLASAGSGRSDGLLSQPFFPLHFGDVHQELAYSDMSEEAQAIHSKLAKRGKSCAFSFFNPERAIWPKRGYYHPYVCLSANKLAHELVVLITPEEGDSYLLKTWISDRKREKKVVAIGFADKGLQAPATAHMVRQDILAGWTDRALYAYLWSGVVIPGHDSDDEVLHCSGPKTPNPGNTEAVGVSSLAESNLGGMKHLEAPPPQLVASKQAGIAMWLRFDWSRYPAPKIETMSLTARSLLGGKQTPSTSFPFYLQKTGRWPVSGWWHPYVRCRSDGTTHELVIHVKPDEGEAGLLTYILKKNMKGGLRKDTPYTFAISTKATTLAHPYLAYLVLQDILAGDIEKTKESYVWAGVLIPGLDGAILDPDSSFEEKEDAAIGESQANNKRQKKGKGKARAGTNASPSIQQDASTSLEEETGQVQPLPSIDESNAALEGTDGAIKTQDDQVKAPVQPKAKRTLDGFFANIPKDSGHDQSATDTASSSNGASSSYSKSQSRKGRAKKQTSSMDRFLVKQPIASTSKGSTSADAIDVSDGSNESDMSDSGRNKRRRHE